MAWFVLGKCLRAVGALWIVLTLTFFALRTSGDPALAMLPPDWPPDAIAAYKERWGLDRPLPEQYATYLLKLARGDFGNSFRNNAVVLDEVMRRVPKTLSMMLAALAVTVTVGVGAGIAAALRRGARLDRILMALSVAFYSVPNFFLGVLLILLFSVYLGLLPTSGSETWSHLVLPALTLGLSGAAVFARVTRAALLDTLRQPYLAAAQARGLSWPRVVSTHAMPNAAIPIVTLTGLTLGGLIGGAVVTEAIFAWPGVGRLLVISVENRDLPMVQAIVVLIAVTMVVSNLVVDMLYAWLDPRIRLGGER